MCRVKKFFNIVPEIRIRVRRQRVIEGRYGSVEKRHGNYKLWMADHLTQDICPL